MIGGAHHVAERGRHGVDGGTRVVGELPTQLHGQLSADSHVREDGDEPADGCQFVRREDAVGDFVYDVLAVDVGGIQVGHVVLSFASHMADAKQLKGCLSTIFLFVLDEALLLFVQKNNGVSPNTLLLIKKHPWSKKLNKRYYIITQKQSCVYYIQYSFLFCNVVFLSKYRYLLSLGIK